MLLAESILNALGQPILVLDENFCAMMANPAFYQATQTDPGQLVGKRIHDIVVAEGGPPKWDQMLHAIATKGTNVDHVEIACTVPPNTRRVFSIAGNRVAPSAKHVGMIVLEFREVTLERKFERVIQAESHTYEQHGLDLEGINRELEAFTHSVSHDLRTPLRLMSKIAHLLLQQHGKNLPADAIDKINMILDSTQEMGSLIESLLSFSQVNRITIKRSRVDLAHLVREVLDELQEAIHGRDIKIDVGNLPPCQADRVLLKQVLMNLIENALKFTRKCEHAEIEVASRTAEDKTTYFVRDNGIGFDMKQERAMFLAFHRLGNAREVEGSGIGLALARRIIERHGGHIRGESAAGEGATIYFTLP
jgi:signal transduction histidine kinase